MSIQDYVSPAHGASASPTHLVNLVPRHRSKQWNSLPISYLEHIVDICTTLRGLLRLGISIPDLRSTGRWLNGGSGSCTLAWRSPAEGGDSDRCDGDGVVMARSLSTVCLWWKGLEVWGRMVILAPMVNVRGGGGIMRLCS
ncbi:hypothetical protein Tco_0890453 [Tanacetum coccineum]|uniref:Uncharacterized protein n=1 Tax=Tanacetum coccineum TaxID=301880 RepID=A0ABQ5C0I3_9ASTR